MNKQLLNVNNLENAATMSSLEIAELTGKEHKHVMRDIKSTLEQAGIDESNFGRIYKDSQNRERQCFNLPRRECDLVISGYSVKYRLAIIDRWHELEQQSSSNALATPDFNNPAVAARAWADQYEARLLAEKTKAEIGSRREATAMNTASVAVKKANKLEVELDQSKQYCTVKRMQMIHHGQKFNWRLLKSTAIEMGIPTKEVFDANYGKVKAYHVDVWQEAYAVSIEGVAA